MTRRLGCCAILALALPLWLARTAGAQETAPAPEEAEAAQALFEQGLAEFQAHSYEAAITAFEDAYRRHPRADILFALAQAERLSGDCPTALQLYKRFLEGDPPEQHASVARAGIERCEKALASKPLDTHPEPEPPRPPEPPKSREEPAPIVPTPPPVPQPAEQPTRRAGNKLALGLSIAGGAGLAAGGVLFALASSEASTARDAESYEDYVDHMDRAETRRTAAWISVSAGTALVAAAAVRLWVFPGREQNVSASLVPTDGGLHLVASGTF